MRFTILRLLAAGARAPFSVALAGMQRLPPFGWFPRPAPVKPRHARQGSNTQKPPPRGCHLDRTF